MTESYSVRAARWRGGWELHVADIGVTQCRTLAQAEQQVRDYLETLYDCSFDEAAVRISVDLKGIESSPDPGGRLRASWSGNVSGGD